MRRSKNTLYVQRVPDQGADRIDFFGAPKNSPILDVIYDKYMELILSKKNSKKIINKFINKTKKYIRKHSLEITAIINKLNSYRKTTSTNFGYTSSGEVYYVEKDEDNIFYLDKEKKILFEYTKILREFSYVPTFLYDDYIVFVACKEGSLWSSLYYATVEEYNRGIYHLVDEGVVSNEVGNYNFLCNGKILYAKKRNKINSFDEIHYYIFDIKNNKKVRLCFESKILKSKVMEYYCLLSACKNFIIAYFDDTICIIDWNGNIRNIIKGELSVINIFGNKLFCSSGSELMVFDIQDYKIDLSCAVPVKKVGILPKTNIKILSNGMVACVFSEENNRHRVAIFDSNLHMLVEYRMKAHRSIISFEENGSFVLNVPNWIENISYSIDLDNLKLHKKSIDIFNINKKAYNIISGFVDDIRYYGICKKDLLDRDIKDRFVFLTVYGAYGMDTIGDYFSEFDLCLADSGFISIYANIRNNSNSGEYGSKLTKYYSIFDTISVAKYVKQNIGANVIIHGVSAGGIAAAGALNEMPHLFAGAVLEVPLVDLLMHMIFTEGEMPEFGDIHDILYYFYVKSYCPYQNIRDDVKYPPVLIIAGKSDDRVPVEHVLRYYLKMSENKRNDVTIFIDEYGHFAPLSNREAIIINYLLQLKKMLVR